jgi:outer membrane lipoprotein-sorting protein
MSRFPVARRVAARVFLAAAASAIVGAAALRGAPQAPADDHSFDAIYRRGSQINADMKTLTARFTETTGSSLLSRPLVASGTVAVQRPSKVVLHYTQPEVRDVLIDGDTLVVSWPGRHLRDVTNIAAANRRIQKYFVDSSPAALRSSFDIADDAPRDRPGTYRLTMLPKRKQIREGLTRLELWLDQKSLLLAAMRMTFPNGDTKLMELDGVAMNAPIDPAVFTVTEPSGPVGQPTGR